MCHECDFCTAEGLTAEETVTRWNTRATPALSCPDGFRLVPVRATAMMALRGAQATGIFDPNDTATDYFDSNEFPHELAPKHRFDDDDERPWILAAAIYNAAVEGHFETQRRLEADPNDAVALSWSKPFDRAILAASPVSLQVKDSK